MTTGQTTCRTCDWHEEKFGFCKNRESIYYSDITGDGIGCLAWKEKGPKSKMRKEVKEQLG